MDLTVSLAPHHKTDLRLRNPVMTAAGTFGDGTELASQYDVGRLGAVVTRTTSLRPQRGHAAPRIAATPAGIVHSTGHPNPGIGALIRQASRAWERWSVPVVVSITGSSPHEYARLAHLLEGVAAVGGIELNLWGHDGAPLHRSLDETMACVREAVTASTLPVLAKLVPGGRDVRRIAEAAARAGASAVTVSGQLPGMVIDPGERRSALSTTSGTLSGPAIRPVTMRQVYLAASALDLPVVASGGASTGEDVAAFIMAGASAVQIGSATFADPGAPWRILEEFEAWCTAEGVANLDEIRGVAYLQRGH